MRSGPHRPPRRAGSATDRPEAAVSDDPATRHRAAYVDGLRLLAGRELSEAQVRQRLLRRGHGQDAIAEAIARLLTDRAIDDRRAAESIARHESSVRGHGRVRVLRRIEAAGIPRSTARAAADEALSGVDADQLLEAALTRRLRGRDRIADDREFQRLCRYLLGQGFEFDRVMTALRRRR